MSLLGLFCPVASTTAKSDLTKAMALRCVAGEFDGSAWHASLTPECLALSVFRCAILYQMDKISPVEAAARRADRARVVAEATEAERLSQLTKSIFVERKGSAPVATACARAMHGLVSELNPLVRCVADFARAEAVAASQAELESKAAETEELVKQLR